MKMVEETLKLAYGENSEFIKDKRIAAVQSLSGTGACRLFADFQKRFRPDSQIYIPVPTWAKLVFFTLLLLWQWTRMSHKVKKLFSSSFFFFSFFNCLVTDF